MKAFQKGQMGFDFMFALVAMLLIIQFLIVFSDELTLGQNKMSIRNQEQTIALKIKSVYNACLIADRGGTADNTSITAKLPPIHDLMSSNDDCKIDLDADGLLSISYDLVINQDKDSEEIVPIIFELQLPEASGIPLQAACGEEITVSC